MEHLAEPQWWDAARILLIGGALVIASFAADYLEDWYHG